MNRMQPLRDEHGHLRPHIEELRDVADRVGDITSDDLRESVERVHSFLVHHIIPHGKAENAILYPAVSRALGAPGATATMTREHVEVGRLIDELAFLRAHVAAAIPGRLQEKALRRVLYGLYALLRAHFAKEDEIFVPLLESRLTDEGARELFRAMEEAERRAEAVPG